MASKRNNSKSLTEAIAKSFEPRKLKDPEIDSEDETVAKLVDVVDDDFEYDSNKPLSDIRKKNVKLLSEINDKYRGQIASRENLDDTNYENEDDQSEDDLETYRKRLRNYQIDSEADESLGTDEELENESLEQAENEEQDSDYDSSASGNDDLEQSDKESIEDSTLLKSKSDSVEDIQKGLSVQNQLKIWEKLLEVRIHSHKMLINANSLPTVDAFNKFCEKNEDFLKLAHEAQQNVSGLLDKMMEMQQHLMKQYSETRNLLQSSSMKRKISEDNEVPTKKFASELHKNFEEFRSYSNSVLQKWHDRTKVLMPGAGTKGNKTHSNNFDIVKKIEGILLNKCDMIKKSQTIKGSYTLFGQKEFSNSENNESNEVEENSKPIVCPEIYDDSDFYHQQLRELIEYKTNTLANPIEMSKQFAELQKLRHKMKKKVDTRATKGRKIRYVVHKKLVNFMAPNDNSTWTEESKNELYRSLFAT